MATDWPALIAENARLRQALADLGAEVLRLRGRVQDYEAAVNSTLGWHRALLNDRDEQKRVSATDELPRVNWAALVARLERAGLKHIDIATHVRRSEGWVGLLKRREIKEPPYSVGVALQNLDNAVRAGTFISQSTESSSEGPEIGA